MSAVQHTHEGQAVATSSAKSEAPAEVKNAEIPANAETGNVDKIREILFGGQMRDYDKRFARLEERLLKESNELREGNRRSLEALETFVKNEFASLANRLQMEQQSREGSDQNLSRELQEAIRSVEGKLTQFQNQTTETQRDLRQQLLDQSKSLNEEIRRKHDDLSTTIEREVADLSHEKTDRSSLSALFTELALRLNNDFKIPGEN
jgi:exonuclease VII large subunit